MSTQAPRLGQRRCPVLEGTPRHCGAVVRPGHLMCGRHWSQVPVDLRTPVLRTWGRWQRTHEDPDWDAYMTARHAALQHFLDQDGEARATPSLSLTWADLDDAALVLVHLGDRRSPIAAGFQLEQLERACAERRGAVLLLVLELREPEQRQHEERSQKRIEVGSP